MANTKSAIKNARKTVRRTARNRMVRSRIKTLARKSRLTAVAAPEGQTVEEARAAAIAYVAALDKAAKRGIIHPNAAARRKSRLSKVIFAASAS